MSRSNNRLIGMIEDAYETSRSEWIEVHGESNVEIYDEAHQNTKFWQEPNKPPRKGKKGKSNEAVR